MIIILTQCFPPTIGGIENLIFNLSYFLSKNHKVIVLADQKNIINDIKFDNKFKNNFLIRRFGGIKFFRKRNKFKELKKIIQFQNVEAIISDSWKSLEIPIKKINNNKFPFFCLVHGNEIIIKNKSHHNKLLNIFSKVDKLICNSEFTKNLMNKISPSFNQLEVIYPGIANLNKIKEKEVNLISGTPILLTLARLEKRKGHEFILKAISKIKKQYPKICYIIAGDGKEKSNLISLTTELNISRNVIFIGSVSDNQKKYIFNKTDIMVMPTLDKTDKLSIEGFGISYIEAALFGIPSIASNVGGTKEAVLHNKTGIILEDLKNLEDSIRDLIDNKNKRILLGQNAKRRAESELLWENQIKKYNKIISNYQ